MRRKISRIISGSYLNAKIAVLVFSGTLFIGFYGFKTIEELNWVDALYMTIITFSTVGFETVHILSQEGKVFASIIIMMNIASFAYAISVFSYYFIEGKFFQKMKTKIDNKRISRLNEHIIVCGMGRYGEEIIRHFMLHKESFVIIEKDEERIRELQGEFRDIMFINEDATHDDVLIKAGIEKASAIITALPDDSDNLFTVLSARQLNPNLNIISRAFETKSIRKLKLAGADHVIMPEHIGGFYMATLVSKPDAVEFFSFITNEATSDIAFEEITYNDLHGNYKDLAIRDMKIREKTGANVIGYKSANGKYFANPEPDTILSKGTSFIILGSKQQVKKFRELMKL